MNLQNIKEKHANKAAKRKCDTGPHPRAASVETPRLEKTDFQKIDVCARCFVQCHRQQHVIKVLISRT